MNSRPIIQLLAFLSLLVSASAEQLIIDNSQPRAEIVISDKPLRTVRLAAQELQDGLEKISGAHLPIVVKPTAGATHLFVGRSEHTEALKVRVDDLKDGAFRMVSGDDWLALVGLDTDFTPIEPWAKGNQDLVSGKSQKEWDAITGALWGMPNRLIYKEKFNVPADTGVPDAGRKGGKDKLSIWTAEGWAGAQWFSDAARSCGANLTRACLETYMNRPNAAYDGDGMLLPRDFTVSTDQTGDHKQCINVARWRDSSRSMNASRLRNCALRSASIVA